MRAPKVVPPQEDPAAATARLAEQARAENAQISDTQGVLRMDTLARLRKYGKAVQQAVPAAAASSTANGGGSLLTSNPDLSGLGMYF